MKPNVRSDTCLKAVLPTRFVVIMWVLQLVSCTASPPGAVPRLATRATVPAPTRERSVDYVTWLTTHFRMGDGAKASALIERACGAFEENPAIQELSWVPVQFWPSPRIAGDWIGRNRISLELFATASRMKPYVRSFKIPPERRVSDVELVPPVHEIFPIAYCISVRARQRAASGDVNGAVDDALSVLRTARHLQQQPSYADVAVGLRLARLSYTVLRELPLDTSRDVDYGRVIERLRRVDAPPQWPAGALLWGKANLFDLVQRYSIDRNGDGSIEGFDLTPISGWRSDLDPPLKICDVVAAIDELYSEWDAASKLEDYGEYARVAESLDARAKAKDGNVGGALCVGLLNRLLGIDVRACEAERRGTYVVLLCHGFRARHGRWPGSLGEVLCGDDIAFGNDPFGSAFRYEVRNGTMSLHSVGKDGVDQEGKVICEDGRQKWVALATDDPGDFIFWPPPDCRE